MIASFLIGTQQHFNSTFYTTSVTVIPIFFITLAVELGAARPPVMKRMVALYRYRKPPTLRVDPRSDALAVSGVTAPSDCAPASCHGARVGGGGDRTSCLGPTGDQRACSPSRLGGRDCTSNRHFVLGTCNERTRNRPPSRRTWTSSRNSENRRSTS